MLGRDKNRSTITEKTKIKEKYTVPMNQVRQQIVQGTSLIGGRGGQYQQYDNQQRYTVDPNYGYTQDPYLKNLPGEQQFVNSGDNVTKVERKIQQKITTNIGGTTNMPAQTSGYGTTNMPAQTSGYGTTNMPAQTSGYGTTMMPAQTSGYGTTMPVQTSGMQRKRSSSSSSSQNEEKKKGSGNWANLKTSNVETLGPNQPTRYMGDLPIQQGNIQTGYGPTNVTYDVVNPIESTIYRSSTERKGPILGKNLYGQTGFASTGYSIQQPFPGQNVYVEEDPAKIAEHTKEKFERSIM